MLLIRTKHGVKSRPDAATSISRKYGEKRGTECLNTKLQREITGLNLYISYNITCIKCTLNILIRWRGEVQGGGGGRYGEVSQQVRYRLLSHNNDRALVINYNDVSKHYYALNNNIQVQYILLHT